MQTSINELESMGVRARKASKSLANFPGNMKNQALSKIADNLGNHSQEIVAANEKDLQNAYKSSVSESLIGRLALKSDHLERIAADVLAVAAMPDPVGEAFDMRTTPNGLRVGKRRVPLGVIGAIYESRPNVTIEISALCIKSGNAVILRGGKEAFNTNRALSGIVRNSIADSGLPRDVVQFIESTNRALVSKMLQMKDYIDLMIPRGGSQLVKRVAEESKMPAISGGVGVCHLYVDRGANLGKATPITINSKVSRPYACNAVDTLIIHSDVAASFLPQVCSELRTAGVEIHCDKRALEIIQDTLNIDISPATSGDWGTEFLSLTIAIKIVDSIEEALNHIDKYGSGHTDAIISEDNSSATQFLDEVDSGVVIVNASTVFNDGAQLGLGAEVAISTSKIHARGPMGIRELTSYKWTVLGTGQVRK